MTIPHVFEVGTSSSIQAPLVLEGLGQDISVPLNNIIQRSRGDVPLLELKLSL